MMNEHENETQGRAPETPTESKRSSRRAIGTAVGLTAALASIAGIALVTQSPVNAAAVMDTAAISPAGAQLPWDDTTSSDDPMANGGPHDGEPGRGERRFDRMHEMGDMMRHHMQDGQRPDRDPSRGGADAPRIAGPRELLALAAETLGLEVDDLLAELRSGKSIADIAGENGIEVQDLVDTLVDKVTENVEAVISELVNRKLPAPQE